MKRSTFLKTTGLFTLGGLLMNDFKSLANTVSTWEETDTIMPALFVGHGAPLYVLGENKYNQAWKKIGESIPKPKAIVSISAHWLTPGKTLVTATPKPITIHDFGGFPQEMYEFQYPANGEPTLANDIASTIQSIEVGLDHDWGYDHGTWCVLYHMFPNADIPVIQLSIDYSKGGQFHFDLAKELKFLRKKGVFVIASGNIVHNLRQIIFQEEAKYDWAIAFENQAKQLISDENFQALIAYEKLGQEAQLSIPTPDHYFPLLYTLGMKMKGDKITFPIDGVSYGSTSMTSVMIGS
jgi:4,5-DOPA dioxygenase extradiol